MPQPTAANREHEAQGKLPWPPVIVYSLMAVGATGGIAVFMKSAALDMRSPVWFLLAPLAMWAPTLARFVVLRTVDRRFRATLPLQNFAGVGGHAAVVALALPIVVYGTAYGIAWIAGWVYWSPGGGLWTTNSRIALNVLVNASILGTYGTMTALGEELGWRGYLQPCLDTAGVRGSFVVVGLCWSIYHAPFTLVDWSGTTAGLAFALAKGLVLDVSLSYLWAQLSYGAKPLTSRVPAQFPQRRVAVAIPEVLRRWRRDVARGRRRATALLLRRRGDRSCNRRPEAGRSLTRVVTRLIEVE